MVTVLWFFMSSLDGSSRQIDLVSLLHSHYEFEEEEEETVGVRRMSRDSLKPGMRFEPSTVVVSALLRRREDSETPKL